MSEINGKGVLILLFLTIAISVLGTVINMSIINSRNLPPEITGKSTTGSGNVQILIKSILAIDVVSTDVDFGSGEVTSTLDLSTEQVNPGTFNPCIEILGGNNNTECGGIQIENTGNAYTKISMISDSDGNNLLLGNNLTDEFRFAVVEGNLSRITVDSCRADDAGGSDIFPSGSSYLTGFMNWTNISKNFNYVICNNLSYSIGSGMIVVEFNITVPEDEGDYDAGQSRVAVLTFIGEQV